MIIEKDKMSLINIINKQVTWEEAIYEGVKLLVNNNIATLELANSIIENTKKLGPYYVLLPKVALAHTNIGSYNKEMGLSLVLFKESVKFSDEERHEVMLLFTLSAIDADSHMNILQKFANTLSNNQIIEKALNSSSKEELLELFKELL